MKTGRDRKGFVQIEFILEIGLQQIGVAFEIRNRVFGLSAVVCIIKGIVGSVLIAEDNTCPKDMSCADLFIKENREYIGLLCGRFA